MCVSALPAVADPAPSREYPKTYTERVTPWYDPAGLIRKVGDVFTSDAPVNVPTPAGKPMSVGTPVDAMMVRPPGDGGPAWKWYGYGTVTPNQNPHAPQGVYRPITPDWHAQSGTTPGAVPGAGLMMPQRPPTDWPSLASKPAPPSGDLILPPPSEATSLAKPPVKDEENKPAVLTPPSLATPEPPAAKDIAEPPAATIKSPAAIRVPGQVPDESPAPPLAPGVGATLRKPVRQDSPEEPANVLPAPTPVPAPAAEPAKPVQAKPVADRPAGTALPITNTDTPDIPVEAAPGIVIPGGP